MDKKKQDAVPTGRSKRYDRPGHLDPAHAERLLRLAREGRDRSDDTAFLRKRAEGDDLASQLGETTVASMTSGEPVLTRELDVPVAEELGGPFVVTSASEELTDAEVTTLAPATREPLSGAKVDPYVSDDSGETEPVNGKTGEEGAAVESREPPPASARTFARIYWPRVGTIASWFGQRVGRSARALARSTLRKAGHRLRRAS